MRRRQKLARSATSKAPRSALSTSARRALANTASARARAVPAPDMELDGGPPELGPKRHGYDVNAVRRTYRLLFGDSD